MSSTVSGQWVFYFNFLFVEEDQVVVIKIWEMPSEDCVGEAKENGRTHSSTAQATFRFFSYRHTGARVA